MGEGHVYVYVGMASVWHQYGIKLQLTRNIHNGPRVGVGVRLLFSSMACVWAWFPPK